MNIIHKTICQFIYAATKQRQDKLLALEFEAINDLRFARNSFEVTDAEFRIKEASRQLRREVFPVMTHLYNLL